MENPHTVLKRQTCASACKKCELKVKLRGVGARKRKKMHFL